MRVKTAFNVTLAARMRGQEAGAAGGRRGPLRATHSKPAGTLIEVVGRIVYV